MLCKAIVAVCSDIRTKHSTQSERHVEFLNVKPWWYGKKPLGFRRLNNWIKTAKEIWLLQWRPVMILKDNFICTNKYIFLSLHGYWTFNRLVPTIMPKMTAGTKKNNVYFYM